jgi:hypothetical protein
MPLGIPGALNKKSKTKGGEHFYDIQNTGSTKNIRTIC